MQKLIKQRERAKKISRQGINDSLGGEIAPLFIASDFALLDPFPLFLLFFPVGRSQSFGHIGGFGYLDIF
jgi:hypothetical protein